jgi:hypothetical protein
MGVFAPPAFAAHDSLNQIETAATLAEGDAELSVFASAAADGDLLTLDGRAFDSAGIALKYGLTDRLTLGVDFALTESDAPFGDWAYAPRARAARVSAKFAVAEEKLRTPGLAVGAKFVGADDPCVYIVVSKHATELIGFHGGLQINAFGGADNIRPFAGVELNPAPGILALFADYQWNQGDALDAGALGLGFEYSIAPGDRIAASWFIVNEGATADALEYAASPDMPSHIVAIEYTHSF